VRTLGYHMYPVELVYIDDEIEFHKIMTKFKDPIPFPPSGAAITIKYDTVSHGTIIIVVLGDYSDQLNSATDSILTHEAVHVWQFVKQAICEKRPGAECEAYAIQFYTRYLTNEFYYRREQELRKAKAAKVKRKAARLAK